MKKNIDEKIKLIIKEQENKEKSLADNDGVLASPVQPGEVDEKPSADMAEQGGLEDEDHSCYVLRRRPGESPGVELRFRDNQVRVLSYGYFRVAALSKRQTTLLLLFSDGKVTLRGRGLVNLISAINERKLNRLIEQHKDLDNGVDESVFIYEMVAELEGVEDME